MGKRFKTFGILIIGVLISIFFVGCSCSNNKVEPVDINLDVTEKIIFVGDKLDINYNILPDKSNNTKVTITSNKPKYVSVSTSSMDSSSGKVTVSGNMIDKSGATIRFTISGTNITKTALIKVYPEPGTLSTPNNVQFNKDSNKIEFKNVQNASSYEVNIDGNAYTVNDTYSSKTEHMVSLDVFNDNVPLTYNTAHVVKVKAKGDNIEYVDGEYSGEYKFMKYSKVENVAINNGVITWDSHPSTTFYQIKVNGNNLPILTTVTNYTLSDEVGDYDIEILAVSNKSIDDDQNQCYIFASDPYVLETIRILDSAVVKLDNANIVDGVISSSLLVWDDVEYATKYKISVSPSAIGLGSNFEVDTNQLILDDRFSQNTTYTFNITPIGNPFTTISATPSTITVKKMENFSSSSTVSISNNILNFPAKLEATKYAILLESQESNKYVVTSTNNVDLSEQLDAVGTYRISIRAIGDNTLNNIANSDMYITNLRITKLGSTFTESISNAGLISWDKVDGASKYNVYLDDVVVDTISDSSLVFNFDTNIDLSSVSVGEHSIKIVSVGDGINTISSGLNNTPEFKFTKLNKPNNVKVLNDTLTFDSVSDAINYEVKTNDGQYKLIGANPLGQSYKINENVKDGTNNIYIVAKGNGVDTVDSDEYIYTINRLGSPTNVSTNNGVLTWDLVEGTTYEIVIGDDKEVITTTSNSVSDLNIGNGEQQIKIRATSTTLEVLSSDYVIVEIVKVNSVEQSSVKVVSKDNTYNTYCVIWDSVDNASSYDITITGNDNIPNNYSNISTCSFDIPTSYLNGTYTIKIIAIGDEGYVNSNPTEVVVQKLNVPKNIVIKDGIYTWESGNDDFKPISYQLGIIYGSDEEIFVKVDLTTSYDFSQFGESDIIVRVRALGNEINQIASVFSPTMTLSRNSQVKDVKILDGILTWKYESGTTYKVYGTTDLVNPNYKTLNTTVTTSNGIAKCKFNDIETNKKYLVYIVSSKKGYINSIKSEEIKITKLDKVSNFKLLGENFVWDNNSFASKYAVSDNNSNTITALTNTLSFSNFGKTSPGDYSFNIYAIGSVDEISDGYINSDILSSNYLVTILNTPKLVEFSNNILTITNNDDGVLKYRVVLINGNDVSDVTTINDLMVEDSSDKVQIELSDVQLNSGVYRIEVYAMGNGENIINCSHAYIKENIEKIDETTMDLRVSNGILTWNSDSSKTYDLYVDGKLYKNNISTYCDTLSGIEKNTQHIVELVSHQSGKISSNRKAVYITKLPDISNFKIVVDNVNEITKITDYKFTWDSLGSTYLDSDLEYYFEIVPEKKISAFNGITDNKNITSLMFNYGMISAGNYQFNIRAMGKDSIVVDDKVIGFVNGDLLENPITITILSELSNVRFERSTNTVRFDNPNTLSTGINIAYQYIDPNNSDNNSYLSENLSILGDATTFDFDYPDTFTPGVYNVIFTPMGDIDSYILNASSVAIIRLELLETVTNIRVNNGYLNWTHSGDGNTRYQIFVDNVLATYDIDNEIIDSFENNTDAIKLNEIIKDSLTHSITIKAIKPNCVDSKYSNVLRVSKLAQINDVRIENSKIYFTDVVGANGYVIKCVGVDNSEVFNSLYNAEYDGYYVSGSSVGSTGTLLPLTMTNGNYDFYVVAVGTTGDDTAPSGVVYLTGTIGNYASCKVLPNTDRLYIDNGVVNWNEVDQASDYKVDIYFGESADSSTNSVTIYTSGTTSVNLDGITFDSGEFYVVRVTAIGNGSTTLNSSNADIREMLVYKPAEINDLKVKDGYITWEIDLQDKYLEKLNNDTPLDSDAKDTLLLNILGRGSNHTLSNNVSYMNNLEVTINDKVYKNQSPFKIELDSTKTKLVFYYDFNFTYTTNPYNVKIRLIGNTTPVPDTTTQSVLASNRVLDGNTNDSDNNVFSGSDYSVVSGVYSNTLSVSKLTTPQSPVVPGYTMISNDKLYFTKVSFNGIEERYLITCENLSNTNSDFGFVIDNTNIELFRESDTTYAVPIKDIKGEGFGESIVAGQIYNISVKALGTKDSDTVTAGESLYLTSDYDGITDIEMLETPDIKIIDGKIAIKQVVTSKTQVIQIWSTSFGETYKESFDSDENYQNGNYAKEIKIYDGVLDSNNPHYKYFEIVDGYYLYTLTDNNMFPSGQFHIASMALGDGVSKITSDTDDTFINDYVSKLGAITDTGALGGYFRWNLLKQVVSGESQDITDYNLNIRQYKVVGSDTELVKSFDVQLSSNNLDIRNNYCYYDLDSYMWPYADSDGNVYKYEFNVYAMGLSDSTDSSSYVKFVNGNSHTSGKYSRIAPPQNVAMVNGKLTWQEVAGAVSYEVYMLDTSGQPVDIGDFAIVAGGSGFRQVEFTGSDFLSNTLFNLKVRAMVGSDETQYLNSSLSIDIMAKKLEVPNLRLEGGVIKWNSTDLNYAIASGVNITISKLDNTGQNVVDTIYKNSNLSIDNVINTSVGYDLVNSLVNGEKLENGYYKIEVGYIGSNGYVDIPNSQDDITLKDNVRDTDSEGIKYCWFSSDIVSMIVNKLEAPVADMYIVNDGVNSANYISVPVNTNSAYYKYTVVKYDESGNTLKSHVFTYRTTDNTTNFTSINIDGVPYKLFNLSNVAMLDESEDDVKFGENYTVYVQLYGLDGTYENTSTTLYSISNMSNPVVVEVPVTPSNLSVDTSSGVITWENASDTTRTRIRIYYNGSETPVIREVEPGINNFKLETIGDFEISILSYIVAINGEEMCSAYTDSQFGTFTLFESGSGLEDDPYIIVNGLQLLKIDYYLDAYFKLGQDIQLDDNTYDNISSYYIGRHGQGFDGKLDGDGHNIVGIKYAYNVNTVAFISEIGESGVVTNLNLGLSSPSTGTYNSISFAGLTITNNGTISNVTTLAPSDNYGVIKYRPINNQNFAGIAINNNGTIINTINKAKFTISSQRDDMNTNIAGLVVNNKADAVITESGNIGDIEGVVVGGIATTNYGQISKSYNTAQLTATIISSNNNTQPKLGGIVANYYGGDISYCYTIIDFNISSIVGGNTGIAGGIVADGGSGTTSQMTGCYAVVRSITSENSQFGIIAGSDGRNNVESFYNYNYYINLISGTSYNTLGNTNSYVVATNSGSANSLADTLVTKYNDVYKHDTTSLNNGYPVFVWQN